MPPKRKKETGSKPIKEEGMKLSEDDASDSAEKRKYKRSSTGDKRNKRQTSSPLSSTQGEEEDVVSEEEEKKPNLTRRQKKVKAETKEKKPSVSAETTPARRTKRSATSGLTVKDPGSWLSKLPQPTIAPPLNGVSRKIDQEDHFAFWFHIFTNFNEYKPPLGEGMNKYNWMERKLGKAKEDRHKFGWGEYLRCNFMSFAKNLLIWIRKGSPTTGISSNKRVDWLNWILVVTLLYEHFRPPWADIQKERRLGQDGNERMRQASNLMLKKILSAVET